MGSDEIHLNIWLAVRDKVTRQWLQSTPFEERGEPKRTRAEVLPLTILALPLGQTASHASPSTFRLDFHMAGSVSMLQKSVFQSAIVRLLFALLSAFPPFPPSFSLGLGLQRRTEQCWLETYLTFFHKFRPCQWHHWNRLLGAEWHYSWSCFCEFQMSVFNKQDNKSSERLLCVFCFNIYSISVNRARVVSSVRSPIKSWTNHLPVPFPVITIAIWDHGRRRSSRLFQNTFQWSSGTRPWTRTAWTTTGAMTTSVTPPCTTSSLRPPSASVTPWCRTPCSSTGSASAPWTSTTDPTTSSTTSTAWLKDCSPSMPSKRTGGILKVGKELNRWYCECG